MSFLLSIKIVSDLPKSGLWSESFGGHTDKHPFGPAAVGLDVSFMGNVKGIYGLPEHADDFAIKDSDLAHGGEPYRFFNLDVFEYELSSPMALYGAIPMVTAVHGPEKEGESTLATGMLWVNPSDTFVHVKRSEILIS